MSSLIHVSEATTLALHAMTYLASYSNGRSVSARAIAEEYQISEAHLSKVLQRLARLGFIDTQRGPHGGVRLAKPAGTITLLAIYEAVEGPLTQNTCLWNSPVCGQTCRILGGLMERINRMAYEYLSETKLSDVAPTQGMKDTNAARRAAKSEA